MAIRQTPAFELQPGDEIRVECVYESLTRNETTFYGDGTSDEMCFGIMSYYPAVSEFTYCGQWRQIDECSNEDGYICDFQVRLSVGSRFFSVSVPLFGML